jgi:nicotinic acid mononucleotide adenylyltransferase
VLTSNVTEACEPRAVAIFGLSADPPTGLGGHAGIVRWCASALSIPPIGGAGGTDLRPADEVWVLPVYRHIYPAKQAMAPYEARLAMARLAFEHLAGVRARVRVLETERELYEQALGAAARESKPLSSIRVGTYDVMQHLVARHPETRFGLVLGADTYADLRASKWKEARALERLVAIVGLPRPGFPTVPDEVVGPELEEVSSSAMRASTDRAWLERVLQPEVLDYILEHRLYAIGRAQTGVG